MKKWLIGIGAVIILGVAAVGYFSWQSGQAAATTTWQTEAVTRGSLTATVGATGTVRANQSATFGWETSGQVGTVLVKLGDSVTAGQVLAELDPASLGQSIILARADLVTAQRNLETAKYSAVAQAQALQAKVAAEKELEDAKKDRESKKYQRATQDTIDLTRADLVQAEDAVTQAEQIYDFFDDRAESDPQRAAALSQLANARKRRDQAYYNLNYVMGMPDDLEVAEADARYELANARYLDAVRDWERVKDGPNPDDVAAAQARVDALQSTIDQVNLEAPFNGTVTRVSNLVGDRVSPGAAAFRVDDLSRLLVDVQITEVDINNIQVGQPAQLTFDAVPSMEYEGVVTEVATVGEVAQGVVNFNVTVALTNPDANVRVGMTAAVNLVTTQLEDVLLVPNRAVRLRDGKRVVFVMRDGLPSWVEITLGASSDMNSEVTGGDLKESDLIVINPPQADLSGGPFGGGG